MRHGANLSEGPGEVVIALQCGAGGAARVLVVLHHIYQPHLAFQAVASRVSADIWYDGDDDAPVGVDDLQKLCSNLLLDYWTRPLLLLVGKGNCDDGPLHSLFHQCDLPLDDQRLE